MSAQFAVIEDIGLQHALRNGLAVLHQQQFDATRRAQILNSLVKMFAEANDGSAAVLPQRLVIAIEQRSAFERFSLFYHHLNKRFGDDVPNRVKEALEVLTDVRNGALPPQQKKEHAVELLQNLLDSIESERALRPLIPPTSLSF